MPYQVHKMTAGTHDAWCPSVEQPNQVSRIVTVAKETCNFIFHSQFKFRNSVSRLLLIALFLQNEVPRFDTLACLGTFSRKSSLV